MGTHLELSHLGRLVWIIPLARCAALGAVCADRVFGSTFLIEHKGYKISWTVGQLDS